MQKRTIPAIFRPGSLPEATAWGGGVPASRGGASSADGAAPVTSSSSDTSKTWLNFTSLSRSGTLASVSHLLTDCRDTSSASARSPWDRCFSARRRLMLVPRLMTGPPL